jgi:hypothetical protein
MAAAIWILGGLVPISRWLFLFSSIPTIQSQFSVIRSVAEFPQKIHKKPFASYLGLVIIVHLGLGFLFLLRAVEVGRAREKVEGLMRDLNLLEVERKGLNFGLKVGRKGQEVEMQALGKVLSEKPVFAEGLENSLGRVWCPSKGVRCKEMGGNMFLFTFLQGSGKKKKLC